MVLAPSETVQLAPSEVVLWQLMAVQEQYLPLEGLVATAVKAVVAVVVVFVVVVVLVVHVVMCLAVVPPSDRVQWVKLVERAGRPHVVGRPVSLLPPVEAASQFGRHWWPMLPEFVSPPPQLL